MAPAVVPHSSTRPLSHSAGRAPGDDAPAHRPGATSAVPPEILRQVRLIELRTRGLVNSMFGGEYHSVFKGQGMEFAEVREYQAGDDIRSIDWNVTARMRHPYVKKHVEERELTVLLAVDLSGSEQFGTRGRFKAELATEIAAVLALSAIRNNDRVGLLVFSDHVEHFVPPKKGRRHVLRLIRDLLAFRPVGRGTDLVGALEYALKILPHRSIIFVLSDFLSPLPAATGEAEESDPLRRMLRMAGQRHDLVAVTISDVAEEALPAAGLLVLTDPETGEQVAVDTGKAETRALYRALVQRERERLRKLLRQLRVEEIDVRTDASYVAPLLAFFRRRERQLRR
ncbi:MAG TPA: DUF58 domain-containing protein [Longimicrobiales bacterium]|nr:DUF58 domain-containing protein [Longimicrobiales bacterium]